MPIALAIAGVIVCTQDFAHSMNGDPRIVGEPLFLFFGKEVFNPVYFVLSIFKYIFYEEFQHYYLHSIMYILYFGIAALIVALFWTIFINYVIKNQGNIHGTARFATVKDLKKNGLMKKRGIICGQTSDAIIKVDKSDSAVSLKSVKQGKLICHSGKLHTLLIGPSGEGKSFVIIPTIWSFYGHALIFDTKSENFEKTSREKSKHGRVIKFSPTREESIRWNPVEDCMREGLAHSYRDSDEMATILFAPAKESSTSSENGEYFTQSGKSFVTAALMHIRYSDYPEKNLGGIRDFFANGNQEELQKLIDGGKGQEASGALGVSQVKAMMNTKHYFIITQEMYDNHKAKFDKLKLKVGDKYYDPELQKNVLKGASDIMQTNAKERASVWKTIATKIRDFDDPNIRKNMNHCDFTIQDFIDSKEPITLYLCVPNSEIDRISAVIRLFVTSFLMRLTENDSSFGKAELKIPLLILLDEFPLLGTFSVLEKEMGILRSYNVFVMIVAQSLNQIVARYGQNHPFLDHCSCQIVYAPGEVNDAEYFSKRMGMETVHQSKVSRSGSLKITSDQNLNYSDNDFSRALMDGADIQRLPSNQALIFVRGMQPYIAKKIPYWQDSRFKNLQGPQLTKQEILEDVAGLPSVIKYKAQIEQNRLEEQSYVEVKKTGLENDPLLFSDELDELEFLYQEDERNRLQQNQNESGNYETTLDYAGAAVPLSFSVVNNDSKADSKESNGTEAQSKWEKFK